MLLVTHGGIGPPSLFPSHPAAGLHSGLTLPLEHTRCFATKLMDHMARQEGLEPADSGIRSSALYPSELLAHVDCHCGVLYNFRLFIPLHLLLLLFSTHLQAR